MDFDFTQISPCPLSKHYRIPENQAWQSLTVYLLYRLTLGSVLAFLFFLGALPSSLGKHDPGLYATASSLYLGSIFFLAVPLLLRRPAFPLQAQLHVLADVVLIPSIMYASGGVESGVGLLLALSVAAGGILTGGRCALLLAALASVAVLGEEAYAGLTGTFDAAYTYAGMLGASFFGIALLALVLARRAEQSEAIAAQRSIDLANLQQLNEFIIRHLQSGIVVIDEQHRIRMMNDSAARLLGIPSKARHLETACPELSELFWDWLDDPTPGTASLGTRSGQPVQIRFTRLGRTWPPSYMAFLEDNILYNQRVQQSKLASLGRLTASIAHEIRNPLTAISHAAQLLAECPSLESQDRRLTQIILDHTARVNVIVENVLQISRRGQSKREILPLASSLKKFLRDYRMAQGVPETAFRLEVEINSALVLVDPSHLKQILENLFSNALKYGEPQRGPIRVRARRQRGEPCIEVVDHASPIDAQTVQQMFEPFFTTSASGTGLGLFIARELAELNQAKLEYELFAGGGCFRLRLADAEKTTIEL
ncbi:integral membrane sensor signal transduction histidine kinase [Methylocaldum marinum]|uniref:histidine kinase n=1 Tax=Methylocaldum marinum TaxID=1432792 RepID=A0A250KUJ9_9GAMM|nr:ATP-binding protein [Methylocaldum marinum]BBA35194.1 integral membrane sensor signal transduction histidine kinase [Methylocaldum marinum]